MAGRGLAAGVVVGLSLAAAGWARGGELKYAMKAGETYAYDVKIVAELPDSTQTLSGVSQYRVKQVDGGQITLEHSASLMSQQAMKRAAMGGPGRMGPPRGFGGPRMGFPSYNSTSEVVVDETGKAVRSEKKAQLPFLLGSAWELVLEPLPQGGENTWQVKREVQLSQTQDDGFWMPRPFAEKTVEREATETIDYSLSANATDSASIQRKYEFVTAEKADGEPVLEDKGEGKIEFDKQAGVVKSLEEKYTIRVNQPGVTVRVPVTVTAHLLSKAEAEKKAAERAAAVEKLKQQVKDRETPKAVDDATVKRLLGDLKSGDEQRAKRAAEQLATSAPIEARRSEVAAALGKLLESKDVWTQRAAAKALQVWGTKKSVPALIKALDDDDHFVRAEATKALGVLKDERGAEAVAQLMTMFEHQQDAKSALIAMGPVAEKPVLALLKNRDWNVRMAACEVLGEVGTKDSLEDLRAAEGDKNGLVKMKAEEAVGKVEKRE